MADELSGARVIRMQIVQAMSDMQRNRLRAFVPPQLPGDVVGQRGAQIAHPAGVQVECTGPTGGSAETFLLKILMYHALVRNSCKATNKPSMASFGSHHFTKPCYGGDTPKEGPQLALRKPPYL